VTSDRQPTPAEPGSPTPLHPLLADHAQPLERGTVVGRYVITSLLGAGGMGVVHAAYDPDLDRKLALKLLRPERYPSARASRLLLREAQALARLAHPNVVAIHDVGTHAGRVWLAMEFVSGQTLRAWLAAQPRSWREIVDVLVAAGRGIAAAHDRGLLHRDIKPDNIMIDGDGRVRVMDFGLARATADPDDVEPTPAASRPAIDTRAELSLTELGSLAGTPAYMAPELFLGQPADPRSDQFSFCVTLWELLHGERPFVADSERTLATAIVEGRRRVVPGQRRLPAWLRRTCERGLASDPRDRWPSIDALLDELARARIAVRRRGLGVALGLCGLALAGAAGWQRAERARQQLACTRAGEAITEVWNPQARARLELALRATEAANAEATIERLVPRLDGWAERWAALREQACVEAEIAGTRPPALAEHSRECLEDQRDLLASLLEVLLDADRAAVNRALPAVIAMAPLERCLDDRALERRAPPPEDPQQRERLDRLRRELVRLRGRFVVGDYAAGIADAEQLLARVEPLAAPALAVQVRATLGELVHLDGQLDRAEQILTRTYLDAGDLQNDELAAYTAIGLAVLVGFELDRHAEGEIWLRSADMLVRRLDDQDGQLGAKLLSVQAHLDFLVGAYDDAERGYARALALDEHNLGPEHPDVAETLTGLAAVLEARGDYPGASRRYQRALEIREHALGPEHPTVAASLHNLGLLRSRQGDGAAARQLLERALAIWEAAHGPEAVDVATALHTLAVIDKAMGRYPEARAGFERALAIRERALGPDHRQVGETLNGLAGIDKLEGNYALAQQRYERIVRVLEAAHGVDHPAVAGVYNNLAELHRVRGDHSRARELHEHALAIRERTIGPDHPSIADSLSNLGLLAVAAEDHQRARELNLRALAMRERLLGPEHTAVAISLNNLGEVELSLGALDDAEAHYLRALAIMQTQLGAEHLHVSYPLHGLGLVALERGRASEAIERLQQSLALREANNAGPSDRAEVRVALARALWRGGQRSQARAAAKRALDEYREAERADGLATVEAWLRSH